MVENIQTFPYIGIYTTETYILLLANIFECPPPSLHIFPPTLCGLLAALTDFIWDMCQ